MLRDTRTIILFSLLFLVIQINAASQTSKIDSLTNLVSSAPDSIKIVLQLQIAQEFISRNYDSISFYSQNAYDLAKKQNNQKMMDSAQNLMGETPHLQLGDKYAHRARNKDIAAINNKIAEMEVRFETTKKEADLEKAALENKLQEQKLNEENFQLIAILSISIITVAFVITFYYLRSKQNIADKLVQDLQVEALKERLFELQLKHEGTEKIIDIGQINKDLPSPLTEREIEALQLSLKGLTNGEIAEKLFISINSVKFHLQNIYKKLSVKGKKEVFNYVAKFS